jgi:hypothetical protein
MIRNAKRKNAIARKTAKGGNPQEAKKKEGPKRARSPYAIFADEKRPIIAEAARATGGKIDAADIDLQIAALWEADETDQSKYEEIAEEDMVRYADEQATFAFEGGAVARRKKRTAAPKGCAASFVDGAQSPPAQGAVPPHQASTFPAVAASVFSYSVGYLQPFFARVKGRLEDLKLARTQRTRWAALQLLAAGGGSLRAPICNHTLRVASGQTTVGQAIVRRVLLLSALGELQELHELRTRDHMEGTCDFILSMLEQEAGVERDGRPRGDGPVSRALASLRIIKGENLTLPLALIRQCAATLTELDCFNLNFYEVYEQPELVLPRCTRLESLTLYALPFCPPDAWLGLSQLHTLRGVSFADVSASAIAAALPRLHTLHLNHVRVYYAFPVAEFFDELLPRLRSFRLYGSWPSEETEVVASDVRPLPLLDDLMWCCSVTTGLPPQLVAARPSTLDFFDTDLLSWLEAADGAGPDAPPVTSPLARVRALTIRLSKRPPEAASIARLLRAAPQLRYLTFHTYKCGHVRWIVDEFTSGPEFAELVHYRLRRFRITSDDSILGVDAPVVVPSGCGVQLRQRHFPRLRRLTVDDEEYPV